MTPVSHPPQRSRASRLLTPLVVCGMIALALGKLHVPRLIATIILLAVLAIMFGIGYGPRPRG